jgi:hypothetical protein
MNKKVADAMTMHFGQEARERFMENRHLKTTFDEAMRCFLAAWRQEGRPLLAEKFYQKMATERGADDPKVVRLRQLIDENP